MYCRNCGANLPEGTDICNVCGTPTHPQNRINPNRPSAPNYNRPQNIPGQVNNQRSAPNPSPNPGTMDNPRPNPNFGQPNTPNPAQANGTNPSLNPGTMNNPRPNPNFGQPNTPNPAPTNGPRPYPNPTQASNTSKNEGHILPPPRGTEALSTSRSAVVVFVLTALTCGIYGYYFIYKLSKDVNTVCAGDGKKEIGGLGPYILYSILTCGAYSLCWRYTIQERMRSNAERYGIYIQETGLSMLLYQTIGIFLCFLGPVFSFHVLTDSANKLCEAYNRYNHL